MQDTDCTFYIYFSGERKHQRDNREAGASFSGMEAKCIPVFRHGSGCFCLSYGRFHLSFSHSRITGIHSILVI